MRTLPLNVLLGLLLLFLMLVAPLREGRAQPAAGGDSAQKADQLFQKGKALYASGKVRDAREALLSAWTLKRSYDIAANLGTVELELGMNRDAAEHLGYSVRTFPSTGKKKNLAVTKQQLDEARKQVGALAIKVNVDGAEVLVDGVTVGRAPLADEVFVEAGGRTVEAKASGYQVGKMVVQVAKGGAEVVNLALVALAAPVGPVASGGPVVPAGDSGSASAPPPPPVGSGAAVVPPPVESGGPSTGLIVAGGVTSGVALGLGVVFTLVSNANANDAEAQLAKLPKTGGSGVCHVQASVCKTIDSDRATRDQMANAAVGTFIGAGAIGTATILYAVLAPRNQTTGMRMLPVIGVGQAGAVVTGVW